MPLLLRSEEHTSELQSPCNLVCLFCLDRKSTRLNSSHLVISYAVFCLKKKRRLEFGDGSSANGQKNQLCLTAGPSDTDGYFLFFFFNDTATTEIYTLSLHDALPI